MKKQAHNHVDHTWGLDPRYVQCAICKRVAPLFRSKGLLGHVDKIEAKQALLFGDETPPIVSGRRGRRVQGTPWSVSNG